MFCGKFMYCIHMTSGNKILEANEVKKLTILLHLKVSFYRTLTIFSCRLLICLNFLYLACLPSGIQTSGVQSPNLFKLDASNDVDGGETWKLFLFHIISCWNTY